MNNIKYREDIDALRGVSVLLVVIYHAFPGKLSGGFIGVDVFFVISGYLITSIIYSGLKKDEFSFLEFYKRRIRRIFPVLFTVLLASLIIGWLILFPDEYEQLGHHVSHATIFIQNFTLIKELGYFDVSSHYKPLLHLWTLSIEEQYYLVWPAILVLIFKSRINSSKFLISIILMSFITNIYFVNNYKDQVFFHSITRFWELGLGSLLAIQMFDNHQNAQIIIKLNSKFLFMLGLILILFSAFWIKGSSLYPHWIGLCPTVGTMLIIKANLQLRHWGGLVKIGLISYPLYMWHWVIISFFYIYLGKRPDTVFLLIAIAIAFLLSYLTKRYIEKVRYIKSDKIVVGLILIAITVGLGAVLIDHNDGMPNRRHLNYMEKFNIEFTRTPATDKLCDSYVFSQIQEKRSFNYCRTNFDSKRKLVAIIGDSHAHGLFPGIAEEANNYGYDTILLANKSCPPLMQFMWGRNPKEINNCQIKINQILKIVKLDKRIEKVIFVARGPVYIHGEVNGIFTTESVNTSLNIIKTPSRQTYEKYFDGFEKTLYQLNNTEHIKEIYCFLENPEIGFLPKEVLHRPFDSWDVSTKDSTIDRSLYRLRMNTYRNLVFEKSAGFSKVTIVDVEPYLCDGDRCFTYKNGNFLYADQDHFSVFGSHYIAKKVKKIMFEK
ncbi:MAG: acyltransferase [Desulfobacula sp.]|nr:acyltransferase [Desulfobacula sp.]